MLNYIKKLGQNPTEIYTARNMSKKYYFSIILLMGLLLTLLSTFNIREEFTSLSNDYQEIQSAIPDFELINNQLESEEESFIYQTDRFVFYFDPQDKISSNLIDKNMTKQQAPISAALKKENIYLNILGRSQSVKYADLNMTSQDLRSLIQLDNFSSSFYFIVTFIVLFLFNSLLYITQLFSISIFANLISFIQGSKLNFFQNAKITIIASIVPFLLMGILNIFDLSIAYQFELTSLATLFLFYMSISEFKDRLQKNNKK